MSVSENRREDQELLQLIAENNHEAFQALFDRYWQLLYNYVYKFLDSEAETEDVLQELFCSIWIRRSSLEITNLRAYLLQAARLKSLYCLRKRKYQNNYLKQQVSDQITLPTDRQYLEKEAKIRLDQVLSSLPNKLREIYLMRFYEQRSVNEIAEIKKVCSKTIQNQLSILIQRIKQKLLS